MGRMIWSLIKALLKSPVAFFMVFADDVEEADEVSVGVFEVRS
jgi:hypothetical protein